MPRNLSTGAYSPPAGTFGVPGSPISSSAFNAYVNDISNELTNSVDPRGEIAMQAALNMGGQKITNVANGVASTDAANISQINSVVPSGLIAIYGNATAPSGWLICNGAAVSRTTFSALFLAIGTAFGSGDGSTTFNLPDFTARFPAGVGIFSGPGSGSVALAEQLGQFFWNIPGGALPPHAHTIADPGHSHGIIDPGHSHGISQSPHAHVDAGHQHSYTVTGSGSTLGAGFGGGTSTGLTGTGFANIQATNANVSINGALTSVSAAAALTGITATTLTGQGQAMSTYPPFLGVYFIIKT